MRKNRVSKTILLGAFLCTGIPAYAVDWLGGDGNYSTGTEWSTGVAPLASEDVIITSGVATSTVNLARNGRTEISGTGTLVINNARYLGGGILDISANGKLTLTGNYFLVGIGSLGVVNQSGGNIDATIDRGFFLSDNAQGAGSIYNLTGGSLNVTHVGAGADAPLYAVHIGKGGSFDRFTIDGGIATFTSTATTARNVWFSRSSTFELKSGSAAFSGYEAFTIGRYRNGSTVGTSLLDVSGGTFSATNIGSFTLGGDENGEVFLSGGTMTIGSMITLGGTAGSTGTITMTGGELTAFDIQPGNGNPLFNFLGGDLFLQSDRTNILDEAWFIEVEGTTAVYDSVTNTTHVQVVPEPSTLSLIALPLLIGMSRRRRSS